MRNIFRTISALFILLTSFSHHAFSQGDKSRYENMVIEAVELINASEGGGCLETDSEGGSGSGRSLVLSLSACFAE